MATNRDIAESEDSAIEFNGETVGRLIPCQAILSNQNPNFTNKNHAAYNIIAAAIICKKSFDRDYSLLHQNFSNASTRSGILPDNLYYLIIWDKKIKLTTSLEEDFSIFFCSKGLVFSPKKVKPSALAHYFDKENKKLKLESTNLPKHIHLIVSELFPFTENAFLRFFYLYQVIEYLMSDSINQKIEDLRRDINSQTIPSITDIKEILNNFNDASKEKSRISTVLHPNCNDTCIAAEKLLDHISIDHSKMSFAEKVYRIRNTFFHDYRRLHDCSDEIKVLGDKLFLYLLGKKLLVV